MPYATNGDISIYYEVHGDDGPGLVFAHGAGGNATSWWQQVPAFTPDHRVVVFDHRGFARSACPVAAQNPRFFEGDLMAVMDAAGLHEATIACQSMGGWTGVRGAIHYPDRIRAVFLANTPGAVRTRATEENMKDLQAPLQRIKLANAAISREFAQRDPAGALLYRQISAHNGAARPNMQDPAIYVTPDAVKASGARFQVLAGELDPVFPPALLEGVAGDIGAPYVCIRGAGHSVYFEKPEAFNAALRAFLTGP
uniref:Pimeloyl-ACP methyl ester carboxylesterase n=1 Tax=Candidatus Kentrum eta TaxID=2126337 RepID=A0A450VEE8_9GAMM|nr:MAG: Pimeloyl-ACP methyl ester carboxylesterase [Candidatus Kentron sp. H]VFK03405.1 MAG: Pimeloyl-ACP methyl ester carboxylesterase [Candidatus Kentron sp. H]VFK06002.1 MAG: Pimeloyl-ACP methyl ester carboxylesterase [Candidatus Kentron sp. H]